MPTPKSLRELYTVKGETYKPKIASTPITPTSVPGDPYGSTGTYKWKTPAMYSGASAGGYICAEYSPKMDLPQGPLKAVMFICSRQEGHTGPHDAHFDSTWACCPPWNEDGTIYNKIQ